MEAAEAVKILLLFLNQASSWGAVMAKAQAEGRPISEAEIDAFYTENDVAMQNLAAAIAKAKAEGR